MIEEEAHGVHDYVADPRNADVLISVNGDMKHRDEAVVSVFDSGYILGDGVWEGLRVSHGGVAFLPEHLKRLYAGAKTIDMDIGLTKDELTARLMDCLKANGMTDGVHIRLMVTRGIKKTPYQGPRFTIGKPTIVIIPEYKTPVPEIVAKGVTLFTVHQRRTGPAEQDQKLNSHSKLNCILACIQADKAGADEALTALSPHAIRPISSSCATGKSGPARRTIALAVSRAGTLSGSAARRAFRCSRSASPCSMSTRRTKPLSRARLPG